MPADNELDPLDRWLKQQVAPLPPPPGTFELIAKRARRRKIRKALVTVASAAAVAAAVGVVVPLSTSLHLTTPSTNAVAAGSDATPTANPGSHTTLGTGTATPSPPAGSSTTPSSAVTPAMATPTSPAGTNASSPAYLPPNYIPTSVTWDSTSTGWIIGQAGTPGKCANKNPDICTSVARTDDGGQHWQGVPAPDTGNGVTGLRFLNASYGWAFGPQLWATVDGGQHWHQVSTGSSSVSQLETVNGRAYAVFANCTPTTGVPCRNAYTLMTAVAGSDNWTPVGGVPGNLTEAAGPTDLTVIQLTGTTGYLVAPDNTLYAGPVDGTAWHQVAQLPCAPLLAPAGVTTAGAQRLAIVCTSLTASTAGAAGTTSVYLSQDGGSTWTQQAGVVSLPAATTRAESLTALPDGTLILAAVAASSASGGGIYLLSPGATQWQPAQLSDPAGRGFSYVGMTSATQGVALGDQTTLKGIWMTTDAGKTWQFRPIQK